MKHAPYALFRISGIAALFAASALLPEISSAASFTWNNTSGSTWATSSNWLPATGFPSAAGDVANITNNISSNIAISLGGVGQTVGILNIGDTNASNTFTVGTGTLVLNNSGSGAQINQLSTSKGDIISAAVVLNDNATYDNASTNTGTISGVISGTYSFTKTGTGTLALGTTNTLSGTFSINGGSVDVAGVTGALGTGAVVINSSGTLLAGNSGGSNMLASPSSITLNGGFVQTRDASNRTYGGNFIIAGTGTSTLDLHKNSSSDTINYTFGTLALTAGSNLNITNSGVGANGNPVAIFGTTTITGTSTVGLVSTTNASNTVTLGGINDSGTAATINFVTTGPRSGTVNLGTAVSIVDGTKIRLSGSTSLNLTAGAQIGTVAGVDLGSGATLSLNNNSGGYTVGALSGSGSVYIGFSNTLTIGNTSNNLSSSFAGVITSGNNGGQVVKSGTGTLTLSGSSSYNFGTTVNGGMLLVGANALVSTNGALGNSNSAVVVGASSGTLSAGLLTAGAFTVARDINVQAGNTGVTTLGGDTATASTFSGAVTLNKSATYVSLASGTATFSGVQSGANSVTVGDAGHTGTVLFSNTANTYSGTTILTSGATLEVKRLTAGGSNSSIGSSGTAATSVVFSGGILKYSGTGDTTNRLFTIDANGGTIDASGSSNAALTFSNTAVLVASGTGARTLTLTGASTGNNTLTSILADPTTGQTSLTKSGAGLWILGGLNTYTGLTTVSSGTLAYSANNQIATGGVTVSGATATLAMGANSDTVGTVTVDGGGRITGSGTLTSTSSFELKDGNVSTILAGSGIGLNKTTSGTATITAANSYSGLTDVQNGKLLYGASNVIAAGNVQVSGGVLDLATFSDTVGAVTVTGGSIIGSGTLTGSSYAVQSGTIGAVLGGSGVTMTKSTSGTVTLSAANTFTGATTISAGTLLVSSAGSLASSGVTVGASGNLIYNNTAGYAGTVVVNGTLGGSGKFNGTITGSGQVGPGNSPGILTAAAVDSTGGLGFAFEFTSTGAPTYGNNTASVNDVLRLTDGTAPFTVSLDSSNAIKIYLNVGSLTIGDVFDGGFYTDKSASFLSSIANATYQYYLFNAGGSTNYNGVNYDLYSGPLSFTVGSVAQTADFGGGPVTGFTSEFVVAPEPSTFALLGLGVGMALYGYRRRKAQSL
ncbi:hypothetical protein BH09VER1_BH09VER1_13230 [soil metagenome]